MTCRTSKIVIVFAASLAVTAGVSAQIDVQTLLRTGEDTLGNRIAYPETGAAEITGALVTMMPGASTGWHRHPQPALFYLFSGELTVEYATGDARVFRSGDSDVEAQNIAHNGHNHGDVPVEMVVFYAGAGGLPRSEPAEPPVPEDFTDLQNAIPGIEIELRYLGSDNFIGRPIAGYERNVVYLTRAAAMALRDVQRELAAEGLGLKVFDGYRPQRAVDDFMRWADDPDDVAKKADYYPTVDKAKLVPNGYIARRSGHSRGSTVDLTLIDRGSGEALDMGSPYDFFDPVSSSSSTSVSDTAFANRMKLREVMVRHGFEPLEEEWWHFTLGDEPYPDRYFDFPVR